MLSVIAWVNEKTNPSEKKSFWNVRISSAASNRTHCASSKLPIELCFKLNKIAASLRPARWTWHSSSYTFFSLSYPLRCANIWQELYDCSHLGELEKHKNKCAYVRKVTKVCAWCAVTHWRSHLSSRQTTLPFLQDPLVVLSFFWQGL